MPGGTGRSWRAGSLVLKPLDRWGRSRAMRKPFCSTEARTSACHATSFAGSSMVGSRRTMSPAHPGNVLFPDELPPAIIDFAPSWRPPAFASAIVVADALCWEGAPEELADAVDLQYLLRALIYRAVTKPRRRREAGPGDRPRP